MNPNKIQPISSLCFIMRENFLVNSLQCIHVFQTHKTCIFSTAMHWTRPVEESLLSLFVCMEFAALWLQNLKPIIQIAATVTGRASVSRTRRKSISEIHNKMFPAGWWSYLPAPFQDSQMSLAQSFEISHVWDNSARRYSFWISDFSLYNGSLYVKKAIVLYSIALFMSVECALMKPKIMCHCS